MKQVIAVVMAAVLASLAACEIATKDGIRSIPAHLNQWFGGDKTPVLEARVPDAKTLKEKADDAVARLKDSAKDLAEKAVEAARPRHGGREIGQEEIRQEPEAEHQGLHEATPGGAVATNADRALETAEAKADAPAQGAPAAVGSGGTAEIRFYGRDDADKDAAWNSDAIMNPDYAVAAEGKASAAGDGDSATTESEAVAIAPAEAPGPGAPESVASESGSPEPATSTPSQATHLYFGMTETPDAAQPWSAAATVFDVIVEAANPVGTAHAAPTSDMGAEASVATASAEASSAGQSYFGISATPDREQPWAADAVVYQQVAAGDDNAGESVLAADDQPAPTEGGVEASDAGTVLALGPPGVTSYYGRGDPAASATEAWAAAAAMNPDYADDGKAPAATAADEAARTETMQTADAGDAIHPPAPLGPPGVTSYFGRAEKPDREQAWNTPASMNPDYAAGDTNAAAPESMTETASAPSDPSAIHPPAEMGPPGVTSYFGTSGDSDKTQPWAAPAAMNPTYTTAATTPTESASSSGAATCKETLNGALRNGGITFAIDSARLTRQSYATLDRIAALSKGCGGVAIEVGGYTDNTGDAIYNRGLSERRAQAVVSYLTRAGVGAGQLEAVGHGEANAVASNATAEGRRKNRRIEFSVSAP